MEMENQTNQPIGQATMVAPKKSNPLLWVIILVILLVAGYFLMQKKSKMENNPEQEQNQMNLEVEMNSSDQIQAEIEDIQFEGVSESI